MSADATDAHRLVVPFVLALAVSIALVGCNRSSNSKANGHDHHEDGEGHAHTDDDGHGHGGEGETAGASFKAGEGIRVGDEAAGQIGLQTVEVAEQELAIRFTANARVYETAHAHNPKDGATEHHDSHATAIISSHLGGFLTPGQTVAIEGPNGEMIEGRLDRLDAETTQAIGQVEAIIDLPDAKHLFDFGAFAPVTFHAGARRVTAVPEAALLEAASGTFVYARNGDRFLRTPVKVGVRSGGAVEITEGLYEGDVVVSSGTVALWLIELRFTKGGGHSH